MRILAGVGAWLLGAGTATAGSLLAVSLLGQGIAASPGQQLTAAAVNRALAREAQRRRPGRHAAAPPPARTSPTARPVVTRHHGEPARPAVARAVHRDRGSAGGRRCRARGRGRYRAHLAGRHRAGRMPAGRCLPGVMESHPGLRGDDVTRGPVATARVVFESHAKSVTMTVSCPGGPGGRPVASSSSGSWGGGTDEWRSYRCFPAFSSMSRASVGQAWAARLAWSSSERGIAGETRTG